MGLVSITLHNIFFLPRRRDGYVEGGRGLRKYSVGGYMITFSLYLYMIFSLFSLRWEEEVEDWWGW